MKICSGLLTSYWAPKVSLLLKDPPANAGDVRGLGCIPALQSSPGAGHGNPLQYSCLENPMHRGAWQATVHRVTEQFYWSKDPQNFPNKTTIVVNTNVSNYTQPTKWTEWTSVQFSHSVVSESLLPHGLQHARPPCPSPTPWACSNSCPLSQWCQGYMIMKNIIILQNWVQPCCFTLPFSGSISFQSV